jgi:copper chaperone CopZ
MDNLISKTYNIIGMDSAECATTVENKLDAATGVIGVKIDFAKSEGTISSYEEIDISSLEQALIDTDYYITKITDNNWVAAPSLRKVATTMRQKHNAAKDIEGSGRGVINSGPVTDYDGV